MSLTSRRAALAASVLATPWAAARPAREGGVGREGAMRRRVSQLLDLVEATPEQRSRIVSIASLAMRDLSGQRAQSKALRERSWAILAAPTIDRGEAEAVRSQRLALQERQSKRVLQAMLDAAEVLTPAQRARAAEWAKERASRMSGERRRPGGFWRQSGALDDDELLDALV